MEKKVKVYSCRPINLPDNIEIKQLNSSSVNQILLLSLAKKCFVERDFIDSISISLQGNDYNAIFGAFDKETGNLVGACLLIDKSVAAEQKYGRYFPENHTMFLDFLYVDPNYRHQHIGQNLINTAYNYCGENGFKRIELLCEIQNSLQTNVYDKTDFLRTGVASISDMSSEPYYFIFSAAVNRSVRQFGKVLYATMLDAYNSDEISYDDYKIRLQDGFIPYETSEIKNFSPKTYRTLIQTEQFDWFDGALTTVIDERLPIMDVTSRLKTILKLKKQGVLPYSQAAANGLGYEGFTIDRYLSPDFTVQQVAAVNEVLKEAENRIKNDYILDEFRRK